MLNLLYDALPDYQSSFNRMIMLKYYFMGKMFQEMLRQEVLSGGTADVVGY